MSFVQRTSTTLRNVPKVTAGKRLLQSTASKASDDGNLKPFTDIPGPKALPKLGNWWRYLLGKQIYFIPTSITSRVANSFEFQQSKFNEC